MVKRKWWVVGAAALAAAVSLCFFGVRLRIAPRLILSRALTATITQLDERFENSPVHLLTAALNSDGQQQAGLKLETESKHLGTVVYDMTLQTQISPNRILAEGSVITGGRLLDLSVFVDKDFAAVSSQELVDGRFYGIHFESFSRDIRDRQLLAALIGEETISKWETSVDSLQKRMSVDLKIPDLKTEDIRAALFGILTLKPTISRQEIVLADGAHKAHLVSFTASGAEIAAAAEPYKTELTPELLQWIDSLQQDDLSAVSADFFLYRQKLVQIVIGLRSAERSAEILLHLGEFPAEKTIYLEAEILAGEDRNSYGLQIMNNPDDGNYQETLSFTHTENGKQERTILKYRWDLSSGDLNLEIRHGGKKCEQRLNLTGEGETVTIHARNLRPFLNYLMEQERVTPAICTLTVSPGREVQVPEYRNLDQWSAEDLFSLLGGLGGLLGLKLP